MQNHLITLVTGLDFGADVWNPELPRGDSHTLRSTMKPTKSNHIILTFALLTCLSAFNLQPSTAFAQGTTAFSYQGRLNNNGSPANGLYDLRFIVWDALTNGNIVAGPVTNSATSVTNGLFAVTLDFGGGVFTGPARWLQLDARTNGNGAFTTLLPRQPITPTPYAIMANSASNLLGTLPATQLSGTLPSSVLAGYSGTVTLTNGGNSFNGSFSGSFGGNGAGLTGVPGTFTWQNVTGTSQQAASNTGYLANNAGQVSITLPVSPNVGDIVRVSGNGVGNWKVTQNAGQSILAENVVGIGIVMGGSAWTPRENNRTWSSVASSADGRRLVAVPGEYTVYTSTDSGITWTGHYIPNGQPGDAVASSADGTKLVLAQSGGGIYTSTDGGITWTMRTNNISASAVASSSDGSKLVAVVSSGRIYTSTDSGITWTARTSNNQSWYSVASSSDGSKLVAVVNSGQIYTSTDSGITWTARASSQWWYSVTSSSDGSKLVASASPGFIYTSIDSGISWTQSGSSSSSWRSVASSADGSKVVAVANGGQIYTSKDYGVSWTPCASSQNWQSVASSADASKLVAVVNGGQIYTSIATTTPGTSGYLYGNEGAAIELQYVGNGEWIPVSHEDPISAY
jgi:photosystem II stability/assembly factor-like uncharacterized protein